MSDLSQCQITLHDLESAEKIKIEIELEEVCLKGFLSSVKNISMKFGKNVKRIILEKCFLALADDLNFIIDGDDSSGNIDISISNSFIKCKSFSCVGIKQKQLDVVDSKIAIEKDLLLENSKKVLFMNSMLNGERLLLSSVVCSTVNTHIIFGSTILSKSCFNAEKSKIVLIVSNDDKVKPIIEECYVLLGDGSFGIKDSAFLCDGNTLNKQRDALVDNSIFFSTTIENINSIFKITNHSIISSHGLKITTSELWLGKANLTDPSKLINLTTIAENSLMVMHRGNTAKFRETLFNLTSILVGEECEFNTQRFTFKQGPERVNPIVFSSASRVLLGKAPCIKLESMRSLGREKMLENMALDLRGINEKSIIKTVKEASAIATNIKILVNGVILEELFSLGVQGKLTIVNEESLAVVPLVEDDSEKQRLLLRKIGV